MEGLIKAIDDPNIYTIITFIVGIITTLALFDERFNYYKKLTMVGWITYIITGFAGVIFMWCLFILNRCLLFTFYGVEKFVKMLCFKKREND